MDDYLAERGLWVTVTRDNGEAIEGWLIGRIPQGLLVALDKDLIDIRLITDHSSMALFHQKKLKSLAVENPGKVSKELRTANEAISNPMRIAISRIKFDLLHHFCHRSAELHRQIDLHSYKLVISDTDSSRCVKKLVGFLMPQADFATALHKEVYETLEDSGIIDILDEFGQVLSHLPAIFTIPAYDLEFSSREDLISTLQSKGEKPWNRQQHRASIKAAETARTGLIVKAAPKGDLEHDVKSEKPHDPKLFSRWIAPSLRILAGTGLIAANAAVGLTAGLTSTIVTIGATAVPSYLGVATSIYTGIVQAADGFEKIADTKRSLV